MLDVLEAILKYTAIAGGSLILLMGALAFVMIMLSPAFILAEWMQLRKKK